MILWVKMSSQWKVMKWKWINKVVFISTVILLHWFPPSPYSYLKWNKKLASQVCMVVLVHNVYGFLHGTFWLQTFFENRICQIMQPSLHYSAKLRESNFSYRKRACPSPRDLVPHLEKNWEATDKNVFSACHPALTVTLWRWSHWSLTEQLISKKVRCWQTFVEMGQETESER